MEERRDKSVGGSRMRDPNNNSGHEFEEYVDEMLGAKEPDDEKDQKEE
jgi:hypothetical protein